ncbi:MAG: DUF3530 family protein [Gammaproteobacteria bacterium]|nr:DUF3530 family protein [Gammaproteobacteria bacterium]
MKRKKPLHCKSIFNQTPSKAWSFILHFFCIAISTSATIPPCQALDRKLEAQFIHELKKQIKTGKTIDLQQGNTVFLGIYIPASSPRSHGGIVLVHNVGGHADWPEAIAPLRIELPKYGWNTLSIQLPLLPNEPRDTDYETLFADGASRIKIALDYFNTEGIYNVLIIGQGIGATIALDYIVKQKEQKNSVTGFVGLSMYDNAYNLTKLTSLLKNIQIPVLDVYGSLDTDQVISGILERKNSAKKFGISNYKQLKLIGADHRYTGTERRLVKRIRSWVDRYAPSVEIDISGKTPR